jgi:aminoglycoside 6-adenylyltransferase
MLFEDENRIDLKLINDSVYKKSKKDSLSLVLLDKDKRYSFLKDPNDLDYVIKKPTDIEFKNLCNEFLWLSTYVAKGLARKQILYSKHCLDVLLRDELLKILAIKVSIETNFAKNLGAFYKYLENDLNSDTLILFLNTYTDFNISKNWDSLFSMYQIFHASASFISKKLNFEFNEKEYNNVLSYLKNMRAK